MARPAKAHKVLNCRVSIKVSDMLERFSTETGFTKTAVVENALQRYIEKYYKTGKIT